MRVHSNNFKETLKEAKRVNYKISYDNIVIEDEDLDNFNPVVNTDLLKSVMKEFHFTTKKNIPKNKVINVKYGVLINDDYEYIDFGDYIIKDNKYDPNTKQYIYDCYDFMLKTMIDYKKLNITYPITLINYIKAICSYCELEFNSTSFGNSTQYIKKDYFDNGNYTFRDILDYLAQLVGGWIYIDNTNKVNIKYPIETNEIFDGDFIRNINVDFTKKYGPVNSVIFSRGAGSDNIYRKDEISIEENGLCEIKISDNPFLEDNDRDKFIDDVFNKLKGLEFYILDVDTIGILYLEVGDLYSFDVGIKTKSLKSGITKSGLKKAQSEQTGLCKCLLLNSDVKTIDGLTETHYVDEPEISSTDYKTSAPTDNSVKNAIIQTNKNSAEILLKVNNDEVISAINLSPEKIMINSNKLDIDSIATFTNSKLAEAGSTVINGNNVTTGTINADRLESRVITTDNFSAQKINADNITSGSLNADRIVGGTINASSINLKNVSFTPTLSKIAGWNIDSNRFYTGNNGIYTNGELYMYPTKGGILELNDGLKLKAPNGVAIYNDTPTYGDNKLQKGITLLADGGNLVLGMKNSSYSVNIRSYCSPSVRANPEARCMLLASASNLFLFTLDKIWAEGNNLPNSEVLTNAGSSSSRNVKTNIVEFTNNDYKKSLNLLDKMKLYSYDYKYNIYHNRHKYGFIIDELEEYEETKDFFEFEDYNATIKNDKIDFSGSMDGEKLHTKTYNSDVLDKYLLTCIKAMHNEIKELKEEIKKLKESDINE